MTWNNPTTWAEALNSIERGFNFNARRIGVAGYSVAVCGDPRQILTGHLDAFAHDIIESYDCLHRDYMVGGRHYALRGTDVRYVVARDGNALAYITRAGEVHINKASERGLPRYRDALRRITPALTVLAHSIASAGKSSWL